MTHILVVDDDVSLLEYYALALTDENTTVDLASNGFQALTRVRERRPDVVVLDIVLPGMNGLDVMSEMLAYDRNLPIILNSAYESYRDHFMTWAADAYLTKSEDVTELKGTIRQLIDSRVAV
jgi:DNA-binding response OmpR family regulator